MNVRRGRVLVVEDQDIIRQMVAESLADAGYEVIEAETGDRALLLLLDMDRLDVLVTDIQMPGKTDGNKLALAARRDRPGLSVVYMTGRTDLLTNELGSRDSLMRKPFAIADVVPTVEKLARRG